MVSAVEVPVLIAGAGPIGLTLAADLAWRGVRSLVVEPQIEINPHPRAISIGVRSMEHFRRLGLDDAVIDAGVPRDHALDVVYVTRMAGREIFRFPIPSIDDLARKRDDLVVNIPEVAASPYYKTWTAQTPLERVLRRHVASDERTTLELGWRLASFIEHDDRVDAILQEDFTGQTRAVTARYLVGCDGAPSVVRAGLGIALSGKGALGAARGLYFRAPGLRALLGARPGVMYWLLAPGCNGVIYTIDGGDEWIFNRYFSPDDDTRDDDPRALIEAAIGVPMEIELISSLDWTPRQLVADRFGSKRVFLAGDACHLFVPTGGFGMNTGIGDAVDLSWKIDAMLGGWGGKHLMESYNIERRPVGLANTLEAADNYARSGDIFALTAHIEEDGETGDVARAAIARQLPPKIKHFAPIGVHLGYHYDGSTLIVPDDMATPPRESASYTPTARPGHRAPHVWLDETRSTLDLFGRGFVLLVFDGADGVAGIAAAAKAAGVPLAVRRIDNSTARALHERRLVLVRPDGHVAWRGDNAPDDPPRLIDTFRGAD
jgi:2-polyprenyl-6-methoxyphenol hydroxylase-like FAD-dependent oxidoreductase